MKSLILLAISASFWLSPQIAGAGDAKHGGINIENAWARVILKNRPAAGFMKIHNHSAQADAVTGASSPAAERIELHTHIMQNNVMRMRPVKKIAVPAKGSTEFKTGGYHLMIFGLKHHMEIGSKLPVTVVFENAGPVKLEFDIRKKAGIKKMDHGSHSKHGAGKH